MINTISKQHQMRLLQAIGSCHDIDSIENINRFIEGDMQSILPHEYAAFGVAWAQQAEKSDSIMVSKLVNVNFQQGYLDQIISENGLIESPTIKSWVQSGRPQCQTKKSLSKFGHEWSDALIDYGFNNVGGHGIVDIGGTAMAYFGFGNLERGDDPCQRYLMELMIPHLYSVARCLFKNTANPEHQIIALSKREREALKWIASGKTSWEIGMILNISEKTVKIHTARAMKKLGVHTRAHAVAKAINLGLICL